MEFIAVIVSKIFPLLFTWAIYQPKSIRDAFIPAKVFIYYLLLKVLENNMIGTENREI